MTSLLQMERSFDRAKHEGLAPGKAVRGRHAAGANWYQRSSWQGRQRRWRQCHTAAKLGNTCRQRSHHETEGGLHTAAAGALREVQMQSFHTALGPMSHPVHEAILGRIEVCEGLLCLERRRPKGSEFMQQRLFWCRLRLRTHQNPLLHSPTKGLHTVTTSHK